VINAVGPKIQSFFDVAGEVGTRLAGNLESSVVDTVSGVASAVGSTVTDVTSSVVSSTASSASQLSTSVSSVVPSIQAPPITIDTDAVVGNVQSSAIAAVRALSNFGTNFGSALAKSGNILGGNLLAGADKAGQVIQATPGATLNAANKIVSITQEVGMDL
jgi:hypothetical protein